jgi:hypothetical protein
MKKLKIHLLLLTLIVSSILTGCNTSVYTLTGGEKKFDQTDEKTILITTRDVLDKKFVEVGYVQAQSSGITGANDELRKKAAEIGGNAIINFKVVVLRSYFFFIPIDQYWCRGMVVRYL